MYFIELVEEWKWIFTLRHLGTDVGHCLFSDGSLMNHQPFVDLISDLVGLGGRICTRDLLVGRCVAEVMCERVTNVPLVFYTSNPEPLVRIHGDDVLLLLEA